MNPYMYVGQATENGESLLSLCAGIGKELADINSQDITAVDIVPQYLEKLSQDYPRAKTVCEDSLTYLKKQANRSVDIISIIDGIEHLEKKTGLKVIKEMKRVARKQILLFTPNGFVKNEPHNAWDIEGGDEYQRHLSGWSIPELEDLGFTPIKIADDISQHGEPYQALMMSYYV